MTRMDGMKQHPVVGSCRPCTGSNRRYNNQCFSFCKEQDDPMARILSVLSVGGECRPVDSEGRGLNATIFEGWVYDRSSLLPSV